MNKFVRKNGARILATVLAVLMILSCISVIASLNFTAAAVSNTQLPTNIVVGYWHNFANGSTTTRLRDVNSGWDVINVSFLITKTDNNTAFFEPDDAIYSGSLAQRKAAFISDVQYLQSKGKKVVVSIGGETGRLEIPTTAARDNFLATTKAIVDEYGFDGLDVDLENTSVKMDPADKLGNLVSVFQTSITYILHNLKATYGSDFIISMAPEHVYVQSAITTMSGSWGAYLPFLDACRDILTYIHPQYYNNPIDYWLPDGTHFSGYTADSLIRLSQMLIDGFDTEKGHFNGLRPDQVAFGVPCSSRAATSGFQSIASYQEVLSTMIKRYPTFRGAMTWSTNWDELNGNAFVNGMRSVIGDPSYTDPVFSVSVSADKSGSVNAGTTITWTASVENATGSVTYDFDLYKDGALLINGSASASPSYSYKPDTAGSYSVKVTAKDSSKSSSAQSSAITVTVPSISVSVSSNVSGTVKTGTPISWTASVNGGTGTKTYEFDVYCYTQLVSDGQASSSASFTYTPKTAGSYYVKVMVKDALGTTASTTSKSITVEQELKMLSVTKTSGNLTVGSAIAVTANAEGGIGNKTYSIYVLKEGKVVQSCAYSSLNSLTFTAGSTGTYTIRAYVQDDNMARAVGTTTLTVA